MTTQVDVMDMTAAEIVNEITTAVTTHLESEPMKRIISSNALESFTKVCDSKTPEIIKRIEDTAKDIMTKDDWIKRHVEGIALDAVTYQKDHLQDHVNKIINSSSSHRLIESLAKTACIGHAATATKDFAEVTDEDFDDDDDDKKNNTSEDIRRKTTKSMFTQAHDYVDEEKEAADLAEAKSQQQKHDFLISKNITKFEVKPMIRCNIPTTGLMDEKQAMNMYTEIEDDCRKDGFPITAMRELLETNSCIPPTHTESAETIANISHAIHRHLHIAIPITNTTLLDMIAPYARDRNGYRGLWSMMRRTCQFIRPEPEGWGPNWPIDGTPNNYVVDLQTYCDVTNIRRPRVFSKYQQAKEMLHQAALSFNQPIAMKLDSDLSIWKSANPCTPLPEEWQIEGIADKFNDYPQIPTPTTSQTPAVKAFQGNTDRRNQYNKGSKKFEMKPIQCASCKCGGHQIGEQVCRIAAQFHHIQTYMEGPNKEIFKENAKRYENMNRPKVINQVMIEHPTILSIDEFLCESEERGSIYHADYSSEE